MKEKPSARKLEHKEDLKEEVEKILDKCEKKIRRKIAEKVMKKTQEHCAKNLLCASVPPGVIASSTGLSAEKIRKLKQKLEES